MREIFTLTRHERLKAHIAFWTMRAMGWRPIETAPTDGTVIWVLDGENDSYANVMTARWHTFYGNRDLSPPKPWPAWWGAGWRTGYRDAEWEIGGPYGRTEDVAISPQWWKPIHKPGARMRRLYYWASWVHNDREERANEAKTS